MKYKYIQSTGGDQMGCKGSCKTSDQKLHVYDWLCDVPEAKEATDYIEVQFKNTRKGYYLNDSKIPLEKGDIVAVEASPGHDIGTVTLTGKLVALQMKKVNARTNEVKRVYRKARPIDMEKYDEAKAKEQQTMIRSRQIAEELGLNMKIGDVEYQGDGNKAIFYYIADSRVDFRQLIKVLADAFKVRIEMKQIGARQEAGRIGGIGPCGRELCCSKWMNNFVSVSTNAARYQDISINPQKLAGQCAKLKCCINFEVDAYVEAHKRLPSRELVLETKDSTYYHFKTDVFKREITYSTDKHFAANLVVVTADRVFEVNEMNKKGQKPFSLLTDAKVEAPPKNMQDLLAQDSLTRFDNVPSERKRKKRSSGKKRNNDRNNDRSSDRSADKGNERGNNNNKNNNNNNNNNINKPTPKRPIVAKEQKTEATQLTDKNAVQDRPAKKRRYKSRRPNDPNKSNDKPSNKDAGKDM